MATQRESNDELLNTHGVAMAFRLPAEWVQKQADIGKLPCLRVGRRRLFSRWAVEQALLEQARTANEPKRLLTPGEVDTIFCYPNGRSARLARQGKLPHVVLPDGSLRFDAQALQKLIEELTVKNGKDTNNDGGERSNIQHV